MPETSSGFTPLAASTGQPPRLAMQRLWLTGQLLPAGARLSVEHTFQSDEAQPLEVIYCFPLPRDAALRSFRICGDGWEAHSELQPTADAVKKYEDGIRQGSLSAIARQHGDGVVNLAVGNLRPREIVTVHLELLAGVELHDDGFRFRFPFTLAPGYHRDARAIRIGNGQGQIQVPRDKFGDVTLPPIHQDATGLHQVGFELTFAHGANGSVGSPSHGVVFNAGPKAETRVSLDSRAMLPDRDLILDVTHATAAVQVLSGKTDGRGHFAVIVPSTAFGKTSDIARRTVILLDRSGSMGGQPIGQARRAIQACLGALSEQDLFGLVAFDDVAEVFQPQLCAATQQNRELARQFLNGIDARGGTELAGGIEAAAQMLRSAGGGDVLVLTDGQVMSTETILSTARRTGVRLHSLGIGSASQDRFLTLLARETGGVSRFVTVGERVDLAAVELFASVGRPVASGLSADNAVSPAPPQFVHSGTPVLLFGETEGAADYSIELRWDGGSLAIPVHFDQEELADTVRLLRGSRRITDLESRYAPGETPEDVRQRERVAELLKDMGRAYGLANREMSLVAVVARAGDRPGELPETRVVPVGMPYGTGFNSYFGAAPGTCCSMSPAAFLPAPPPASRASGSGRLLNRLRRAFVAPVDPEDQSAPPQQETVEDVLMGLAAQMEPDGGMPGKSATARVEATLKTLKQFVEAGHTLTHGAFRSHVARLAAFLEKVTLTSKQHDELRKVLGSAVTK